MKTRKPVDVVIVGGGWTGLLMAKELATRTSLETVVLERGPARSPSEYAAGMDELDYGVFNRMMQNPAQLTVTHRHSLKDRAAPIRQYGSFKPGTGTGGAGEHWGGNADRCLSDIFTMRSELLQREGKLPQECQVADFGFDYHQIETDFWRAEEMIGVSGKAGNLNGRLIDGGNIFEGPRSREFPTPPGKKTWANEMYRKAMLELGLHPYPQPSANISVEYKNPDGVVRPGCAYCGFCSGYPCMIGARAGPTSTLMPVLRKHSAKFGVRNHASVRRVLYSDGKATGVMYVDEHGEEITQPADIVILAAWTTHNVRLLLLSKIGEQYDPVTNKGLVGKNLTHQVMASTRAIIVVKEALNGFMNNSGLGYRISDYDGFNNIRKSDGILRGGTFTRGLAGDLPISGFGRIPPGAAPRNWGAKWKAESVRHYDHVMGGCGFRGDSLPWRQNFMDLDTTYTDNFGDPLLRLTFDWTEHEWKQMQFAERIGNLMNESIAHVTGGTLYRDRAVPQTPPLAGSPAGPRYSASQYNTTHVQGGAIMGSSSGESVLNPWQQHWQIPNLWVLGSAAFPQNWAGNPTLAILAVTLRASDALIDRYLKHPGALA